MAASVKDRVFHSSKSFTKTVEILHIRPSVHKKWKSEHLLLACQAVQNGLSIRRASEEYQIPKSTIQDHISGKVAMNSKSGPAKYLTDLEEAELVQFLEKCADIGYPQTRAQIIELAQGVVQNKGLDVHVTAGWWDSFRKRHPNFSLRAAG